MIISPSISQILRGIIHEIGGDFKTDLDPVKSAQIDTIIGCLLYTSPSPRDRQKPRMPSSA